MNKHIDEYLHRVVLNKQTMLSNLPNRNAGAIDAAIERADRAAKRAVRFAPPGTVRLRSATAGCACGGECVLDEAS